MSYEQELFDTCSKTVQQAYRHLIDSYEKEKTALPDTIKKLQASLKSAKTDSDRVDLSMRMKHYKQKMLLEFKSHDAEFIYVLSKIGSSYVDKFLNYVKKYSRDDRFLEPTTDDGRRFFYMYELGVDPREFFFLKDDILADGRLSLNHDEHAQMLKFYVRFDRDSELTKRAIHYWLDNWVSIVKHAYIELNDIASALESLFEYDYDALKQHIKLHVGYFLRRQSENGSFRPKHTSSNIVRETAFCLSALSLVLETGHPAMVKGKNFIVKQLETGKFYQNTKWLEYDLPAIILALINLGDGPKISKELFEREIRMLEHKITKTQPVFVHTSPNLNARNLRSTIVKMIEDAQKEIMIVSPFIDTLYENMIEKMQKNKILKVQIVTRPLKDIRGERERIAKNALDLLNRHSRNSLRISPIVHSRMAIIDASQMIVSSADLTQDQLVDEYNAGLYTKDKESIKQGIEYFKNLYNEAQVLH